MAKRRVTNGEAEQAPAAVDEAVATAAQIAYGDAMQKQDEWEQLAWEMRPHQQAFVRALFALLWLIALELQALRKERAG
jgi:hypothetical protein